MKVTRLTISNFRGVREAEISLGGHSLIVGGNNVGKSTVCEALDLVLGSERLNRTPPIDEYDFFNGRYLDKKGDPIELRIEVVLTSLSEEIKRLYAPHVEFWHGEEQRLLATGEVDATNALAVESCLRLATIGKYDSEEDTFAAKTVFLHSPGRDEGDYASVSSKSKRAFGFLYLRALRTGARALSLERGSLLDIILQMKELRTGVWESTRARLQTLSPPIDSDMTAVRDVLEAIEQRLGEYVPVDGNGQATRIFVSQLTREHLRKTLAFFLSLSPNQEPVPFQEVGTGTLSTLVFALLSFIAEGKKDGAIFAMEEPEIALPPHSQRRVLKYLLEETGQCIVTSHSPYVIERFESANTLVLRRDDATGRLSAASLALPASVKTKTYRNQMRRAIAEALLGTAVIVGEGLTEQLVLATTAGILEEADGSLVALDVAGVSIVNTGGDGNLSEMGAFFGVAGLKRFAFFDRRPSRQAEERVRIDAAFDVVCEVPAKGMEALLADEVPLDRQWEYLEKARGDDPDSKVPLQRPSDEELRKLTLNVLRKAKGEGAAADLVALCSVSDLPKTVTTFLHQVYALFPKPTRAAPVQPAAKDRADERI